MFRFGFAFLFYKTVPGFERYTPMSDVRWQVNQLTHEMIKNDVMNGLNAIMKGLLQSDMSLTISPEKSDISCLLSH